MANRYWVGGTGTWNTTSTTNWAASSGGASGASAPTSSDNVFFDENSFSGAGQTVSFGSVDVSCLDLDMSGITHAVSFILPGSTFRIMNIGGSFTGSSLMTFTMPPNFMLIRMRPVDGTSVNLTMNGTNFVGGVSFHVVGRQTHPNDSTENGKPVVNLTGDVDMLPTGHTSLTFAENFFIVEADVVFNANNFNVGAAAIIIRSLTGTTYRPNVNMGNGVWTAKPSESYTAVSVSGTVQIDPQDSTFKIDLSLLTSGETATFTRSDSGITLNDIIVDGGGNSANFVFNTSNVTGNTLTITNAPVTVKFSPSRVYTLDSFNANGSSGNLISLVSTSGSATPYTISASSVSVSHVSVQKSTASGAAIPFNNVPGGVDGGNNTNWCFPGTCGNLPGYSTSLITSVNRVQQDLAFPKFLVGGQNEFNDYALFKKGSTGITNLWRSKVYQIGTDFDILSITLPLVSDLAANTEIVPVLYFDDEATMVIGTTINNTNYSNDNKLISLTAKNFGNQVHGKSNCFLELRFSGSDLAVVGLPIFIDVDIQDT